MKLLLVAGARPNFMKIASIIDAIKGYNCSTAAQRHSNIIKHVLVHTGQHYDDSMSEAFFRDLERAYCKAIELSNPLPPMMCH
jgi:UDP-N-acetylglucosamine 2-epimerase (non-hydrolysing)